MAREDKGKEVLREEQVSVEQENQIHENEDRESEILGINETNAQQNNVVSGEGNNNETNAQQNNVVSGEENNNGTNVQQDNLNRQEEYQEKLENIFKQYYYFRRTNKSLIQNLKAFSNNIEKELKKYFEVERTNSVDEKELDEYKNFLKNNPMNYKDYKSKQVATPEKIYEKIYHIMKDNTLQSRYFINEYDPSKDEYFAREIVRIKNKIEQLIRVIENERFFKKSVIKNILSFNYKTQDFDFQYINARAVSMGIAALNHVNKVLEDNKEDTEKLKDLLKKIRKSSLEAISAYSNINVKKFDQKYLDAMEKLKDTFKNVRNELSYEAVQNTEQSRSKQDNFSYINSSNSTSLNSVELNYNIFEREIFKYRKSSMGISRTDEDKRESKYFAIVKSSDEGCFDITNYAKNCFRDNLYHIMNKEIKKVHKQKFKEVQLEMENHDRTYTNDLSDHPTNSHLPKSFNPISNYGKINNNVTPIHNMK